VAEQALVADLRVGLDKFNADLQRAQSAADRATANMRKALENVGSGAGPAANEIQKVNTKLDETTQAANKTAQSVSQKLNPALQTMKGMLGALGIDVGARALVQFATSAIKAAESITGVERQLTSLRGSSTAAAAEMAFIRAETDRLALSNLDGAKAYARLANAAKGTKLDGEALKFVFQAIGETMRATGASSEVYNRVLNQLTQTMAKGKFQGEELSTMAENGVPAFQKLADAMGVTTKELSKMLQAGTVSSDNMLLLANQLHKDYAALAEAAATTIPAQFTRGFNTIFNEFVDLTKGVLASSEAIKAVEFESNMLDIFPDPSVVTQTTDNIIKIVVTVAELSRAIFQKVGDIIMGTFRDIADFLGKFLPNLTSFFDNFATWSTKLGQALGFVSKDIDTVSLSTDSLQSSIAGITSIKGVGDVMAPVTGAQGKALVQDIKHLVNEIATWLDLDMKPLVDPKEQTDAAKKAATDVPPVIQDLVKKLEALNRKTTIVNPEAEKKVAQELHDEFLRILDRTNKERIRQNEEWVEQEDTAASKVQDIREKLEDETRKAQEETHDAFLKIVERTNAQRIAEEQKTANEISKIFENMQENIQSLLAGSIRDAMTGDLDNIADFADAIGDLFADTAATITSELLSSFAMEPIMNQVITGINKLVDQAKQKIGQLAQMLGISGGGGKFGEIAGGVFAGVGVGMAATQVAGVNNTGATIGSIAGAVVGGVVGAFTAVGPVIGAAAGSVIGGMLGGILSEHNEKVRLILQTSLGAPTNPHEGPTSRSPFGVVSLFDQSVVSMEAASAATMAISEIDSAIAKYLNAQQRAIVTQYFQTAVPAGSMVQAEGVDDAIAKAIQLRLHHALTALTDEATATNIVGEQFSADAGNIQAIVQRAEEALEILRMIEDFKIGPLSDTAAAINAINDQFQALADRATTLGLPIDEIVAEQNRLLAQVTTDFNEGIANSLLALTDPVAAEFDALEAMQAERYQNAIDAGADLVEVEKLNAAERVELEKRVNEEIQMQSDAARGNIVGLILGMTDPFAAAMHSIYQQLIIFKAQAAEGLIPQELVDEWYREATKAAQDAEDARAKAAADALADFNESIANDILGLTDPIAQRWDDLERRQKRERDQAIAIGADLEQLDRKHALERADLERDLADDRVATNTDANNQINDATTRGAEQTTEAIVSGNQEANEAIVLGAGSTYSTIISGAQDAAGVISGAFGDAASNVVRILSGITGAANAAAASLVNAAQQRPSIPRAPATGSRQTPTGGRQSAAGARQTPTGGLGYSSSSAATRVGGAYGGGGAGGSAVTRGRVTATALRPPQPTIRVVPTLRAPDLAGLLRGGTPRPAQQARQVTLRVPDLTGLLRGGTPRPARQSTPQRSDGGSNRSGSSGGGSNRGGSSSRGGSSGGSSSSASQGRADAQRQAEQRKADAEQKRQRAADAKANIQGLILDFTNPLGAAMHDVNQQVADFRQQSKEGLIPKGLVDQFAKLAMDKVKKEDLERRRQEAEEKREQQIQFGQSLLQFVNPALATMIQINEQVREFQELADKGLVSQSRIDQFKRLAVATAQVDRALEAISGGGGSNMKGIGDAFKSFIEAGLPERSETIQRMQALTEQVAGLIQSAEILGLSTEDLTDSFKAQANIIRQDAITAIDESFQSRRDALKQVDDYLGQSRLSDVLPAQQRLDEARTQFMEAVRGGDISEALQAGRQFADIAQQIRGGTGGSMDARNEVATVLTNMRDREARRIELERANLVRQETRQLEQVQLGRSSVDYLRQISSNNSTTALGINEMIRIARSQTAEFVEMRKVLTRVMHEMKA